MTRRRSYLGMGPSSGGCTREQSKHQHPKASSLKMEAPCLCLCLLSPPPLPLPVNLIFPAVIRRKGRSVGVVA